jgi:uncharacterized membrane protein YsdA (DUF1294 family)
MEWALYWLIAANLTGFILMVWDKARAEAGGWRVAEPTLLLWSVIGGSLGTLAASHIIRHKTRKQPIATMLKLIPAGQAIVLGMALAGLLDPLANAALVALQTPT